MEKLLLSPNEVAEALGIGRPKVYSLLSRGELPSVRVGRSVRVHFAGLRRWVEEQVAERLVSVGPSEAALAAVREPESVDPRG